MTIQLTRREAIDRSLAFLFCAIFVAMVGPFDWIIGATFIDAQMRRDAISGRPHSYAGAEAVRVEVTDQPLEVLRHTEASDPKAVNREAGTSQQADRATPWRAIPSPVSEGSERSDLRVILPTSGAVQVGGSHGVRRELEQHTLGEVAPGLALSSSGIRGEASMVRAQGVRSVPAGGGSPSVAGSYPRLASAAANLCGVPVDLFAALIARESSWNPEALSSSGAVGLAQVKPSTARGVSATLDVYKPFDNLLLGACYLRQQFDRFGSWRKALHAYHAGPTAVDDNAVPAASVRYAAQIGAASR